MTVSAYVTSDRLDRHLKPPIVLFVGSAISGARSSARVLNPAVPMVVPAIRAFFEVLRDRRPAPSDHDHAYDSTICRYAGLLGGRPPSQRYARFVQRIKFEDFVFRLDALLRDDGGATGYLNALYRCSGAEYGASHAAIASLLLSGYASLCLTTNFDNAIELAHHALEPVGALPVWMHEPPSSPGDPGREGLLVKLHGDAARGSYTATLSAMLAARERKEYRYLSRLLAGKQVVVLGYSGHGDIDIAPELTRAAQLGTEFIWATHSTEPTELPAFATKWTRCDLTSTATTDNLLLRWASTHGKYEPVDGGAQVPWRERLRTWLDTKQWSRLRESVELVVRWEDSTAALRLHCARLASSGGLSTAVSRVHTAEVYNQARLYRMVQAVLPDSVLAAVAEPRLQAVGHLWRGFAHWRLGRHSEALRHLRAASVPIRGHTHEAAGFRLFRVADPYAGFSVLKSEDRIAFLASRVYLEVVRDDLRRTWSGAREERWKRADGSAMLGRLESLIPAGVVAASDLPLARLVQMELNYLRGLGCQPAAIAELIHDCCNQQLWQAAVAAAVFLHEVDAREGRTELERLKAVMRDRHDGTYLWKIRGALWRSRPALCHVLGRANTPAARDLGCLVVEVAYWLRRALWWAEARL